MKILWITNTCLPFVAKQLGLKLSVFEGWNIYSSELLANVDEVTFAVASPVNIKADGVIKVVENKMIGYCFSASVINDKVSMEHIWNEIYRDFQPDIVHIQGTEMPHGFSYLKTCGNRNVVASIQGMTSVYERYFYAGVDFLDMVKHYSIYDCISSNSIFAGRKRCQKSGRNEVLMISSLDNIIGRTTWDKSHAWSINKDIKYFKCNEILRKGFYSSRRWNYDDCEKRTIFLSQCKYPIKALHMVLKAMPLVLREFPDARIRIGSCLRIIPHSLIEKMAPTNYGGYLYDMIKTLKLENHIDFLGNLTEEQMITEYLKANVFISPSSIENSPNSLGEAQILGTPSISSNVGGVEDMSRNGETTICYRFEEYEMLAYYICEIFHNRVDYHRFEVARQDAMKRHNPDSVIQNLINIYSKILER